MDTRRTTDSFSFSRWMALTLGLGLLGPSFTSAKTPVENGVRASCGTLETFVGSVQIFDATRNQVLDTIPGRKLECGDWVSVEEGRAVIRHRQGFRVGAVAGSFFQVSEVAAVAHDQDHLMLYRGEIEVTSPKGVSARVSTANARAAFRGSRGIVLFDGEKYQTQLIGIEGRSALAHRLLKRKASEVSPGTFSQVDLNPTRLHATPKKGVSPSQLVDVLQRHGITGTERELVLQMAKFSLDTPFPKTLAARTRSDGGRTPAAISPRKRATSDEPTPFQPVEGSELPGKAVMTFPASEPAPVQEPAPWKASPVQLEDGALRVESRKEEKRAVKVSAKREPSEDLSPRVQKQERSRLLEQLSVLGNDSGE